MTEITKKSILDSWKLLATDAHLNKTITMPASRVWRFFDRLLQNENNGMYTNDSIETETMAQLLAFEDRFLVPSLVSVRLQIADDKRVCTMNDNGVTTFHHWMMEQEPYPGAKKSYQAIYEERTSEDAVSASDKEKTVPKPSTYTHQLLIPVLERQLGMLVAASDKAAQEGHPHTLYELSQAITPLAELLWKMQKEEKP